MIGIYDANELDKRYALLERCSEEQAMDAIADWESLGFTVFIGPAFQNLIILYK